MMPSPPVPLMKVSRKPMRPRVGTSNSRRTSPSWSLCMPVICALRPGERLDQEAGRRLRRLDEELLERLFDAVPSPWRRMTSGPRDRELVAFAPHRLDEDREVELAAAADHEGVGASRRLRRGGRRSSRASRKRRSRIWRLVTNWPSRPANGESFTRKVIFIAGSSIVMTGQRLGAPGCASVSPIRTSRMPVMATMSPARPSCELHAAEAVEAEELVDAVLDSSRRRGSQRMIAVAGAARRRRRSGRWRCGRGSCRTARVVASIRNGRVCVALGAGDVLEDGLEERLHRRRR